MNAADNPPLVSVVCAWHNRANYIRDTLDSLLAQDFGSYEIILVNDGSKDTRAKDILDSYNDPKLRVIHQENTGFVTAICRAIEAANGQFVALQGAGDVSLQGRLRKQSEILKANDDIAIVGCKRYETVIGSVIEVPHKLEGAPGSHAFEVLLHGKNPFTHGEVMFRKDAYQRAGGYRSFFRFAQDIDLWIRMAEGCRLYVIDEALYERRSFVDDGVNTDRNKMLLQQAMAGFAKQCYYDRVKFGVDFIEQFGTSGGLFRKPNKDFSKMLSKFSLQYLKAGDVEAAETFSRYAINERLTVYSVMAYIVSYCAIRSRYIHGAVQKILERHPNAKKWGAMK